MIDIIIFFVSFLVFVLTEPPKSFYILFILVIVLYFSIAIIFIYKIALISIYEVRNDCKVKKSIKIVKIKNTLSLASRWENIVSKLYDSNLNVERYKMKCIDENGKTIELNCIVPMKSIVFLNEHTKRNPEARHNVLIGKYSKVIIQFCDQDGVSMEYNRLLKFL
jgi:hypothetical protein